MKIKVESNISRENDFNLFLDEKETKDKSTPTMQGIKNASTLKEIHAGR